MIDILLIEDNCELGKLICDFLEREGFSIEWKENAEEGMLMLQETTYKLLLLDVMLPGKNGYQALAEIREKSGIPVLMMSARTDDESKILGLEVGADDYIDKPFSIPVLSSKIKALMRRTYEIKKEKDIISAGGVTVDVSARSVYKHGIRVEVKGKEFDILVFLMKRCGTVVDKETLFNEVWGVDCFSELTSLNVYIRWLRERIEDDPRNPKLIQTVWKVGYRFGGSV